MMLYWTTDNLMRDKRLRKFVVRTYRQKKVKVPGLPPKWWNLYKNVSQFPDSHLFVILVHYAKYRTNQYTRFFVNKKLQSITAVLVQKIWGECLLRLMKHL